MIVMIWPTKSASEATRPRMRAGVSDCNRNCAIDDRLDAEVGDAITRPTDNEEHVDAPEGAMRTAPRSMRTTRCARAGAARRDCSR